MPHIGGQPSWHGEIVAVSDGADRKTKNKLCVTKPRAFDDVLPSGELVGGVCIWPCTVGKWAVSITSSTCC